MVSVDLLAAAGLLGLCVFTYEFGIFNVNKSYASVTNPTECCMTLLILYTALRLPTWTASDRSSSSDAGEQK